LWKKFLIKNQNLNILLLMSLGSDNGNRLLNQSRNHATTIFADQKFALFWWDQLVGLSAPFPPTPFSKNREIYLVNPSVYM
jgi:hypothetical protein